MVCSSIARAGSLCALVFVWCLAASGACARAVGPGPPLRFASDTFSFANQTFYLYPHGYAEARKLRPGKKPPAFTLRCFSMCRSVEQFHKFARFDPTLPPPDDAALAALLRRVNRRAVWRAPLPPGQRVVIPGYANLRALSQARPVPVQKNVGGGLITYFRPGNYRMVHSWWNGPGQQARTRGTLEDTLARNDLFIAYLTSQPSWSINHAVVVYARRPSTPADAATGTARYRVYDPNYPEAPREMVYDTRRREFSYEKDWDFVGGPVTVLQVYGAWLQ